MELYFATLPIVPFDVTSKVTDVAFGSELNENKIYFRKILSFDFTPDAGLELNTTACDLITWGIDDSTVITVTL